MSVRSSTLKRLVKERQLMEQSPCREFTATMLEENALEWHFTMMGPPDTPYAEGFYHGKILIPADYPFKPPDVVLLTPNGRFELDKRICLSISSYHPENWHPTWGIATVLHALREFMATPGNNAIGAIEYPKEVREALAAKSGKFQCPMCKCNVAEVREVLLAAPPATDKSAPIVVATPTMQPATPSSTDVPSPLAAPTEPPQPQAVLDTPPDAVPEPLSGSAVETPTTTDQPPPAAVPVAEEAARPAPPPARWIERHGGEIVLNFSIQTIDRWIRVFSALFMLLAFKKLISSDILTAYL